jgi:hypothetical protein
MSSPSSSSPSSSPIIKFGPFFMRLDDSHLSDEQNLPVVSYGYVVCKYSMDMPEKTDGYLIGISKENPFMRFVHEQHAFVTTSPEMVAVLQSLPPATPVQIKAFNEHRLRCENCFRNTDAVMENIRTDIRMCSDWIAKHENQSATEQDWAAWWRGVYQYFIGKDRVQMLKQMIQVAELSIHILTVSNLARSRLMPQFICPYSGLLYGVTALRPYCAAAAEKMKNEGGAARSKLEVVSEEEHEDEDEDGKEEKE